MGLTRVLDCEVPTQMWSYQILLSTQLNPNVNRCSMLLRTSLNYVMWSITNSCWLLLVIVSPTTSFVYRLWIDEYLFKTGILISFYLPERDWLALIRFHTNIEISFLNRTKCLLCANTTEMSELERSEFVAVEKSGNSVSSQQNTDVSFTHLQNLCTVLGAEAP